MQRVLNVLVVGVALVSLAGCSDHPVSSFDTVGRQVYTDVDRQGEGTGTLDLPPGTTKITVFTDCTAGDAGIDVQVVGIGGGGGACSGVRSKSSTATLTIKPDKTFEAGRHAVKVSLTGSAASDVRWSVAITAS